MKNSNEVWLGLEVLEDRLVPNGAFAGGINAGPPTYPPINGLAASSFNSGQPGFRISLGNLGNQPISQTQQAQSLQNQLQALQAAQTAMIDQLFSEFQSFVQLLNLHTVLIL